MTYQPDKDLLTLAELTIKSTYGDTVSVLDKAKGLNKFGKNNDLDVDVEETIMTLQGAETSETYVNTNAITSIVSDDATNTQVITLECHTIDGSGNLTFVVQDVTLNGQTPVTLGTAVARVSRGFVKNGTFASPATDLASGSKVYIYEGGTVTAGVPDTASETHMIIEDSGENQSQKASTSTSSVDYLIITRISAGVNRSSGTSGRVDFRFKKRELGGVFRVFAELNASTESPDVERVLNPYIIVPTNSDIVVTGTSTVNNITAFAAFDGHLAIIKS